MSRDGRVQKFRSGEEMNATTPRAGESDFDRFLRHCARYWALAPRVYPRGVFKFRNVEEAQRARSMFPQTDLGTQAGARRVFMVWEYGCLIEDLSRIK